MDLDSFITSWDSKIDELDYPRGYMPDNAAQSFIESTKPSVETEAGLDLKSRSGRFAEATRKAIHTLKSTLYTDNAKVVSYLAPLTNIIRKTPVTIATLNYDNVLETFLDSHKINYEIGVEDWEDKFELTFPDPGVLLLKLHGSLNWDYELVTSVQDIPFQKFRVRDWAQVSETKNPAIIFGQRDKLTTEGPFLDLLRTFRDELFRCNHLVVVGYSFRDEHINTYIRYWFAKRHNRQLTIIDPSLRTTALPPEIRSQITETYLEPADESDREAGHIDVVEITHDVNHIKKGAGEGLAEFVSQETNTT